MDEGLQKYANQAFVQLVVNVLGCGVLFCFYYNYRVLEAYFLALFWATICSIPMFQLKTWLIQSLVAIFLGEKNTRFTLRRPTIAPYEGVVDFLFRDVPSCFRVFWRMVQFTFRPLGDLFIVPDRVASRPFFGILTRCCVLTFISKLPSTAIRRYSYAVLGFGIVYYIGLISVRLYGNVIVCLSRAGFNARLSRHLQCVGTFDPFVARVRASVHEVFLSFAAKLLVDYVNSVLAICIMVCCVLASTLVAGFCSYCFFQEAVVIWRSSHDFIMNNSFSQHTIYPVLQRVTSGLGNNTRIQEGYDVAYLWAEKNIADFEVMKYVLLDLWDESTEPPCPISPPLAAGYTPTCNLHLSHSRVPKNVSLTTNFIRSIVAGNMTAAAHWAPNAMSEIMALHESMVGGMSSANPIVTHMVSSGQWVVRLITLALVVVVHWLASAFDAIIQGVVFCTALFYLLKARVSVLHYLDQLLTVIDSSRILFTCVERVLRAVLVSALKMSVFHSLFTFVLFSYYELPVVYVPTAITFVISLVPLVPPVIVPTLCVPYLWAHGHIWHSGIAAACNLCVWWSVPASIYAEIPESHPWLTAMAVVLGVSHFGVRGAVLGPLLASVPLICAEMLMVFNLSQQSGSSGRPSLPSFSEAVRTSFIHAMAPLSVMSSRSTTQSHSRTDVAGEREAKVKNMLMNKQKTLLLEEVLSPQIFKLPVPARAMRGMRSRSDTGISRSRGRSVGQRSLSAMAVPDTPLAHRSPRTTSPRVSSPLVRSPGVRSGVGASGVRSDTLRIHTPLEN